MVSNRLITLMTLIVLATLSCKKNNPEEISVESKDFLTSEKFGKLVLEVVYVNGFRPESSSIEHARSFLKDILNKPNGIEVKYREIDSPGLSSYALKDIRSIEEDYRKEKIKGDQLTAFIFFADASYVESNGGSTILGIAYNYTSMAIFEKDIKNISGSLGQPQRHVIEASVIEHELGHTIGLVNNGVALQSAHQDNAHGKHCDVKSCLMYYATETGDIVNNIIGGSIPKLDEQCKADLRAAGGK